MRAVLATLAAMALPAVAHAQTMPRPTFGTLTTTGKVVAGSLTAPPLFYATAAGSCTWDATHDVGPCIAAAQAQAAAAGGGTVLLPAGNFGLATPLVNNASGVKFLGAGTGITRDNVSPNSILAVTKLTWIGAAAATMLDVEPAVAGTISLYAAGVQGIAFDCGSLANVGVKFAQVSNSHIDVAGAECRSVNVWITTTLIADAPGSQQNDVWAASRSTSNTYKPTGILLDGQTGSNWNTSYNHFHRLSAWYAGGDGIVFGSADNNLVDTLDTFANPGNATGRAIVFANTAYVMPNGMAVALSAYEHRVVHVGGPIAVLGYTTGTTITTGTHAGNAAPTTVALTTNAITTYPSKILNFASTAGVIAGMTANCGAGSNSGVMPDSVVVSVTSTTITLANPTIGNVASGAACVFSYGFTANAAPGLYTITAASGTTYNIAAPAGGHPQSGIAISGAGNIVFNDLILPMSGTPQANDTWTVTVPVPSKDIEIQFVDKANSIPAPYFQTGATGSWKYSSETYPHTAAPAATVLIQPDGGISSATGTSSVSIGQSSQAGGFFSASVGGAGNNVSGAFAGQIGGHNLVISGGSASAWGEQNTADGTYSGAFGGYAIARGRFGAVCAASGAITTAGDAQACSAVERMASTTTGTLFLTTNGSGTPAAGDCFNIPDNTEYLIKRVSVVYRDTTNGAGSTWHADNLMMARDSGVGTTVLVPSSVTMTADRTKGAPGVAAPVITADATNGCLQISIVAPNTNASHWAGSIESLEVQ